MGRKIILACLSGRVRAFEIENDDDRLQLLFETSKDATSHGRNHFRLLLRISCAVTAFYSVAQIGDFLSSFHVVCLLDPGGG